MGDSLVVVKILFFAKSRELSGITETSLEITSNISCGDLIQLICSKYNLQSIKNNIILALNQVYYQDITLPLSLKTGYDITMNFVELVNSKLDVTEISELVSHESCGALSIFIGTTRDNFDGKSVCKLEYEAYEPMAITAMREVCSEIRMKWSNVKHIAIYHRLGIVPVKEASIIVAISSPHRSDSMEATQFAMDRIKSHVPIWKKEYYVGANDSESDSQWKENKECHWSKNHGSS